MITLQVLMHRELTPAEGQNYLEQMNRKIEFSSSQGGFSTVKIPGVTRFENPFPDWLQQALLYYKLVYDSVNLCYHAQVQMEANAQSWLTWFDNSFRPWVVRAHPEFDIASLHARAMTEHDDIGGNDSF
jgi:hypothetical protein